MSDLIRRQDAIKACLNGFCACVYDCVDEIEKLPSADAVEVVRCRECKHRDPEDKKCDFGHDIRWQLPRQDDWYCADAERRTDGKDN